MKIKHYIVTYNNNIILNRCLQSILPLFSKYTPDEYSVYIINNHSNFNIDSIYEPYVHVLHNSLRPDFSTGHLSRNWNQAIINGFRDLNNVDCDILITSQNDCEFDGDFISNLIELHKKYSFIQFGAGDNFMSYTVESIKKVGLWDERFCNIGYQEADYFLRQLLYNTHSCTINDYMHKRVHNPEKNNVVKNTPNGYSRGEESHFVSQQFHKHSENIYKIKWGNTPQAHNNIWNYESLKKLNPLIDSYILYPYFEKGIPTNVLNSQNYINIFQ